ncbi:MAG: glycosyltransferase [Gammaproteobacteria bacterium]|nr:glycosyltransferase [Gammaproteobacteria bacterium]
MSAAAAQTPGGSRVEITGIEVSVVIPAHNDSHNLTRLLSTLVRLLPRIGVTETIVVANGCRDDSAEVCRRFGVRCLERPPLSPAAARNEGVAVATGRWLAFLDADTEPTETWFDAVGDLVAGRVEVTNREIAGWPVLAPIDAGWVAHTWQRVRFAPTRLPNTLNCGNLLISRALFDRVGGFNSGRIAGEDVEICERSIALGQCLLFDPRLAVYHYGEPGTLQQFFMRELFHADPLRIVLRNFRHSVVDSAIVLLVCLIGAGVVGSVAALVFHRPVLAFPVIAALGGLTAAALVKAAVKLTREISPAEFLAMTFLCQVMLTARALGTVVRRRVWRNTSSGDLVG